MSRPPEDHREHALAMAVDDLRRKIERTRLYLLHVLDFIEVGEIGSELEFKLRSASVTFKAALGTFADLKKSERS